MRKTGILPALALGTAAAAFSAQATIQTPHAASQPAKTMSDSLESPTPAENPGVWMNPGSNLTQLAQLIDSAYVTKHNLAEICAALEQDLYLPKGTLDAKKALKPNNKSDIIRQLASAGNNQAQGYNTPADYFKTLFPEIIERRSLSDFNFATFMSRNEIGARNFLAYFHIPDPTEDEIVGMAKLAYFVAKETMKKNPDLLEQMQRAKDQEEKDRARFEEIERSQQASPQTEP